MYDLPLDTGCYCLEIAHSTTVVVEEGDTLTVDFVLPDGQDFKAYFNVLAPVGTESSLSVDLAEFTVSAYQGEIELNWKTCSETENTCFQIYRDGRMIGRVAGHGTCTDPHDYTFVDASVKPGVHEYAISDVTYGGEEVLHETVMVKVKAKVEEANFILNKAYPNPFNPRTAISYSIFAPNGASMDGQLSAVSHVELNIYNTQGMLVDNLVNGNIEAGSYELTWDASGMPSGVYIVKMHAGNTVQSQKIVLMK